MEHIPLPSNPRFTSLQFPYYGIPYDEEDFAGYPDRCSFDGNTGHFPDPAARSLEELLEEYGCFYHTWFYFGTLHSFFGPLLDQERFLRQSDDGKLLLTTEALRNLLEEWNAQLRLLEPEEREWTLRSLGERFVVLRNILEQLNKYRMLSDCRVARLYPQTQDPIELDPKIAQSIMLLGEALHSALQSACGGLLENIILAGSEELKGPASELFHLVRSSIEGWNRMGGFEAEGWCPSEERKYHNFPPSVRFYMAAIPLTAGQLQGHENCPASRCIANNITETTYETRHAREGCSCAYAGPSQEEVVQVLAREEVPIAAVTLECAVSAAGGTEWTVLDNVPVVDIATANRTGGFAAISHVWSDGMGNTKGNRLPKCVLQELAVKLFLIDSRRRQILQSGPITFTMTQHIWIDTLCIPVNDKVYKRMAIERIDYAFKRAKIVMVWDKSLLQQNYATPLETLARLTLSSWNRRAWTLQEAFFTQDTNLHVALRDRLVSHREMLEKVREQSQGVTGCHRVLESICDNVHDPVNLRYLLSDAREMTDTKKITIKVGRLVLCNEKNDAGLDEEREPWADALRFVWKHLSHRSTSKAEDMVLIIVKMLDIPSRLILGRRTFSSRLEALYASPEFSRVPRDVIFGVGTKLQREGWRWGPASIQAMSWGYKTPYPNGEVTPRGLKVVCDGILLPTGFVPPKPAFCIKTDHDPEYLNKPRYGKLRCDSMHFEVAVVQEYGLRYSISEDGWGRFCGGCDRIAVLAQLGTHDRPFQKTFPEEEGGEVLYTQQALVVGVKEEGGDGVVYCTYGPRAILIRSEVYGEAAVGEKVNLVSMIQEPGMTDSGREVVEPDCQWGKGEPFRLQRDRTVQVVGERRELGRWCVA